MRKINMSLKEYAKKVIIDDHHLYLLAETDPTDVNRKIGHPDEQVLDKSVDKQSHIDDIEEEVC